MSPHRRSVGADSTRRDTSGPPLHHRARRRDGDGVLGEASCVPKAKLRGLQAPRVGVRSVSLGKSAQTRQTRKAVVRLFAKAVVRIVGFAGFAFTAYRHARRLPGAALPTHGVSSLPPSSIQCEGQFAPSSRSTELEPRCSPAVDGNFACPISLAIAARPSKRKARRKWHTFSVQPCRPAHRPRAF